MLYDLFFDKDFADVKRLVRDSHPYQIVKGEGKDTIIINALGVAEDDIKIEVKPDGERTFLYIEGSTKNSLSNEEYSFKNRFSINRLKIEGINYSTKDGLLYIDIIYKETPAIEIPITRG